MTRKELIEELLKHGYDDTEVEKYDSELLSYPINEVEFKRGIIII
jgi:hypothetical protein